MFLFDDEEVYIQLSTQLLAAVEGDSSSFTLSIPSEPRQPVNITVAVSDGSQATAVPSEVQFTSSNWQSPQTVVITAVDDDIVESAVHSGTVDVTAASGDANYDDASVTYLPGS